MSSMLARDMQEWLYAKLCEGIKKPSIQGRQQTGSRKVLHTISRNRRNTGENSSLKKMIIVSPETHSHLFLIKGLLQKNKGKNITLDEVMIVLIRNYHDSFPMAFQLEEKQ